jgi:hypothetical protein
MACIDDRSVINLDSMGVRSPRLQDAPIQTCRIAIGPRPDTPVICAKRASLIVEIGSIP